MKAAYDAGDIDAFVDALQKAEKRGMKVRRLHLESLVNTCLRAREPGRASAVLAQLETMPGHLSPHVYLAIVQQACENKENLRASQALHSMARHMLAAFVSLQALLVVDKAWPENIILHGL